MSWSITTTLKNDPRSTSTKNIIDQLLIAIDWSKVGNSQCVPERDQQIIATMNAVAKLIVDGGFVPNADEIIVSLSGHANKNHAEVIGWSNDCVSITISIKKYHHNED